eukprot:403358566
MLPAPTNTLEKIKQQEFFKAKIREAFNIVDQERKGIVDKREISYLMRYLLQFPSEAQVRDYIIPKLEDDEPSDYIKYEKYEPYMLQVLLSNEFEPAPAEHLIAAFRILDPEGKGYIKKDVIHQLLTTKGIQLRPTEYEFFKQFALDKTGQYIYYEDYVARLIDENERHLEYLLRGYESFKPSMGK